MREQMTWERGTRTSMRRKRRGKDENKTRKIIRRDTRKPFTKGKQKKQTRKEMKEISHRNSNGEEKRRKRRKPGNYTQSR